MVYIMMSFALLVVSITALEMKPEETDGPNSNVGQISEEIKRLSALVSGLHMKIEIVSRDMAKQLHYVNKRIDGMKGDHDGQHKEIYNMEVKVIGLSGNIKTLNNDMGKLSDDVKEDGSDINTIKQEFVVLNDKVNHLGKASGNTSFEELHKEICDSERRMKHYIDDVAKDVWNMNSKVCRLDGNIKSLFLKTNENHAYIEENVNTLNTEISENKVGIEVLNRRMQIFHPQPTHTTSLVYYPPGSHHNHAQRFYPNMKAKFVGFGMPNNRENYIRTDNVMFNQCISICYRKNIESAKYDGMTYYWIFKQCYCHLHDEGHVPFDKCLHYKFQKE